MRIAVLAHGLRAGGGRVVGTNILDNLKEFSASYQFLFAAPDQPAYRQLELESAGCEVYYYKRKMGHLDRWLFDNWSLPSLLGRFQPQAVLGLGNLGVRGLDCAQAVLVHSPYLFYQKKNFGSTPITSKLFVSSLKRAFKKHLAATNLVFCQTHTIEHRLRQIWGYQGKTVITPNVISDFLAYDPSDSDLPDPLQGQEDQFKIFYLTRYYPHKGLETLVEVMDRFREQLSDVIAVITIDRAQHRNADRLLKQIEEKGLQDRIINVGPLRQDQLAAYYLASDCLVMPTRLESFSATYLESMHFGLPILTSDLDFAHEICGDAALYFDPWDTTQIMEAILRLIADPQLRTELIQNGKRQLAGFSGKSWENNAAVMIAELDQLVRQGQ